MRRMLFSIAALVLALGLAVPLAVPVAAHTEAEPYSTPLMAGQNLQVGEVLVWNDGDNLCVTYQLSNEAIDEGWVITETHLYVGKNNPLTSSPGQFPYDDGDATGVPDTEVSYTIPLADVDSYSMQLSSKGKPTGVMVADGEAGVAPGDDVFIAAHAVVEKVESFSECLVSGEGTDNVLYLEEDSENPGYPIGYLGPYSGTPTSSVLAWEHSAWADVDAAAWIGSAYYTENTDYNTWRLFTRSFDLPANAVNITGHLQMNCDNAEEAYLNDALVGKDANASVYGPSPTTADGVTHGWGTLEDFDLNNLVAGNNTLSTMTRNYGWPGGPEANPTGYAYKLCYSYDIVTSETAWGKGDLIDVNGNWSMYFLYKVQGCVLVETLEVPSDGTPVSSMALESGHYKFKASGTFTYNSAGDWADAEWYLLGGKIVKGDTEGSKPYVLDISVDGYSVNRDWGDYNPEHIYYLDWTGTGASVSFSIYDSAYGDNSGSLTVEIYRCY
jgi:hypothetical protein